MASTSIHHLWHRRTLWLLALILLSTLLVVAASRVELLAPVWAAVACSLLLVLPGYALLRLLGREVEADFTERIILSCGMSLAALPLLLAWMTWLGGRWTPPLVVVLLIACGAIAAAPSRNTRSASGRVLDVDAPTALLLVIVFGVTLGLRIDHIRGVLAPGWSDSLQHVIVSELIIEGGRIPRDYGPLIGIGTFHYHFGFHALVAFWAWLTNLAPHVAVLWMGQVVNALSPLTVYFFLAYGFRDRRAGVVGAVIVGLLTISPANHVNFGRYPQLTGQLLLPVPMALMLRSLWAENGERRPWKLAAISAAGLCLVHYRVVLFFGCFVAANVLVLALVHARRPGEIGHFLRVGAVSAVALLLVAPWLVHMAGVSRQEIATDTVFAQSEDYHHLSWAFVTNWSVPAPLLGAAVLGAAWALFRRAGRAVAVALWVALLFLLSNPRLLGLPTTLVNNGAVVLALYLPAGMLGGYLGGEVLAGVARRWGTHLGGLSLAVLVVAGAAIGLTSLSRRILQPWRFFVTEDDMRAYTWIRQSVPEEAIFAVQAIQGISPVLMHGIDGGYWIPYMARRRSTLPPMPYVSELSLSEAEPINRVAAESRALPGDHEALARLRAQGVTHVYVVGPRPGPVQGTWKPEDFAADRGYRLVYHQGTVWIFALDAT